MCLAGDARVEARIHNGLGDARGGESEQVEMLGTEIAGLFALDIHDADKAVFRDQRHSQLGADLGIGGNVVFRSGDIIEQDGLPRQRHLANDSLAANPDFSSAQISGAKKWLNRKNRPVVDQNAW